MDLYKSTAHELHDKLVNKEISSVELTKALYERIDAVEDQVKAYVTLDKENALAQAAKGDAMIVKKSLRWPASPARSKIISALKVF